MKQYFERQIGSFLIIIFGGIALFLILLYIYQIGNNPLTLNSLYFIFPMLILVVLLFYKMDIYVNSEEVKIVFGIGWIKKRIKLSDVLFVGTMKKQLLNGIGIHFTAKGVLYNIRYTDAVELKIRGSNRVIQIGTEDVENLKREIESRL